jgi:3',5'-cyclic AMP phosphodiesterase CpdA
MTQPFLLGRRGFITWVVGAGGFAVIGCSAEDGDEGAVARTPAELPPLAVAVLTTERTIVPSKARLAAPDARSPIDPADRASLLRDGFDAYDFGPGESVIERAPEGHSVPAPGAGRKVLARFIHVTDIHITDDESPIRLARFDGGSPFDGAARPHSSHMGRVLNAAVRTVNALHHAEPLDFLLLGGDSTDSAQNNEISWLVGILSGTDVVACDSGKTNDPVPGSDNDPKDPFVPEGLEIPWKFCLGNHDTEIMGINAITQIGIANAIGNTTASGAQDWSQPGAPVVTGELPPDENRRPLYRNEMIDLVLADGDGHGLKDLSTDKVSYVFDVGGSLRFVVHDTALEEGGADGILRRPDLEAFLKPALDKAKADGKLVVLVSHHGLGSFGDGSSGSSAAEESAVLADEIKTFLLSYDNVVLSLTGHTHFHVVNWVGDTTGGFWEVQTCSLVEFPNQMRLVEIADEDNGYLSIQLIGIDFATDDDAVAEEGRRLAILDHTSGWGAGYEGTPSDRNVKLYVALPST